MQKYVANILIKRRKEEHERKFLLASKPYEQKYKEKMIEIFEMQWEEIKANIELPKSLDNIRIKREKKPFITMKFDYEDVKHPPLHPNCRCVLLPVVSLKSKNMNRLKPKKTKYQSSQKALDDFLIDFSKYYIMYKEFGQLMLPEIMANWADNEIAFYELGISFDIKEPRVFSAILARSNRFADQVVNDTREQLHRVVSEAIQQGDGIPQITKKIRELYNMMEKYKAVRIARTETIWGQNEGSEWSYIQSGVIKEKEWWTAKDDRRCPFCEVMHGKRIEVGQNFFSLGDRLTLERAVENE